MSTDDPRPAHSTRRAKVIDLLRREREAVEEILEFQDHVNADAEPCEECERLVAEVLSAMLRTRALLSERTKAAEAGLIDDVNFLETSPEVDQAFAHREAAREAYIRHRQEGAHSQQSNLPQRTLRPIRHIS